MSGPTRAAVVATVFTALARGRADACTCATDPPASKALQDAVAVFVGRLVAVEDARNAPGELALTYPVEKAWKGVTEHTVVVFTGDSGWECGYSPGRGPRQLVYARGTPEKLQVSLCTRSRVLPYGADDVAELEAPAVVFSEIAAPENVRAKVMALNDDLSPEVESAPGKVMRVHLYGVTARGPLSVKQSLSPQLVGNEVVIEPLPTATGEVTARVYFDASRNGYCLNWQLVASRQVVWDRKAAPDDAVLGWLEERAKASSRSWSDPS